MLKKTYFKATGMFLFVVLCVLRFSYSLYGKDKPFEMKLIKEFKTGKEYEMYKKAHPEVFGVKKGEEKRIKVEGDRIRFYDEKGKLIRERKIYKGREIFENKNRYGQGEKLVRFSHLHISPNMDLVIDERFKIILPEAVELEPYEIIVYNKKGEITGKIDPTSGNEPLSPYILPNSRYIICVGEWELDVDRNVYVYNPRGNLIKTINFEIKGGNPLIVYDASVDIAISKDGGYAVIAISNDYTTEVILIDEKANVLWRKLIEGRMYGNGGVSISTFGEYIAVNNAKSHNGVFTFRLMVFDKKGNEILKKQAFTEYLNFVGNTSVLVYTGQNKSSLTLTLLDVTNGEILCKEAIEKVDSGYGLKINIENNIIKIGSCADWTDDPSMQWDFRTDVPVYLFRWKASDEMFLKGGGR